MIPFALLSGQVKMRNKERIEVSMIELSSSSFLFRVSKDTTLKCQDIEEIGLNFWNQTDGRYHQVLISSEQMRISEDARTDNAGLIVRVQVDNKSYETLALAFSKMYLSYVESKLGLSDEEHASMWSTYPPNQEEEFMATRKEQYQYFSEMLGSQAENVPDYFISLERDELWEQYVTLPKEEFVTWYFATFMGMNNSFGKSSFQGIHIGNSFCPHLFPEDEMLEELLRKAAKEKLKVTVVLAPTSELMWEKQWYRVCKTKELANRYGIMLRMEMNDSGLLYKGKERAIDCYEGILMNKKRKDVRRKYLMAQQRSSSEDLSMLDQTMAGYYIPFYQMNTGTFCPLHAVIETGERRKQRRVLHCEKPCQNHCFLYPKHLEMVGRYNSLFGFSSSSMNDEKVLSEWKEKKVDVILNL